MELLKDGQVDAVLVDAGAPTSAIIDIVSQHKVKILSIDRANIAKIVKKYPYFSSATVIPEGDLLRNRTRMSSRPDPWPRSASRRRCRTIWSTR